MEIGETHSGNLTDGIARDTGAIDDPMEMDEDETGRQAYGKDDLEFDDTDGGQARNRGASSRISGGDVMMEDLVTDKMSASDKSHSEGLMPSCESDESGAPWTSMPEMTDAVRVESNSMEMDDDGTGKRAYGPDDLELDDTDGGQTQIPGTSGQSSGKKANKRGKSNGNKGGLRRKQMLAKIDKRVLGHLSDRS